MRPALRRSPHPAAAHRAARQSGGRSPSPRYRSPPLGARASPLNVPRRSASRLRAIAAPAAGSAHAMRADASCFAASSAALIAACASARARAVASATSLAASSERALDACAVSRSAAMCRARSSITAPTFGRPMRDSSTYSRAKMIAPHTTWLVVRGLAKSNCGMPSAFAADGRNEARIRASQATGCPLARA